MTTKTNPLAVMLRDANSAAAFRSKVPALAMELEERKAESEAARAAMAELVEAAKNVCGLGINSEMHMKLRAALAAFSEK